MFDSLLWVLHHFITHYAGQTTQGGKDDGDDDNQASGPNHNPKQDTDLPQITTPTTLPTTLQESNILDQSGAPSSANFQPEEECKGGHGIRKISKSCSQQPSQQPSQPELQPSTLHDPHQSDEMSLPAYAGESEVDSYIRRWKNDQFIAFTEEENKYFESEYSSGTILGEGDSGVVYLATRKSDGKKVAYKSIPKLGVVEYALESNPPPICNLRNHLVGSDEQSVEQCMSSRPANLLFPYEVMLQTYLSRPGHDNPHVPTTFDYITLKNEFILVMEHLDEKWMDLSSYVEEKGQLDIEDVRDIVKEIVKAMISLKNHGIVHEDLNAGNVMCNMETYQVKLIDFDVSGKLPGWEEGKSIPLKSSGPPSLISGYKAGDDELWSIWMLGKLLDKIITGKDHQLDYSSDEQAIKCEQVTGHRIQSGLVPAIQKSRLRLLGRAARSGCGECIYLALRWSLKWRSRSGPALVGRGLWNMNLWERGMIIGYWAARLSDFLQVAYRQYQSTLWKYHQGSPCGSWLTDL
ncbi:hypothetical protein BASA50_004434 [Batrachochytrium salamandrivorans]|uniref:non-specific serine/threonine protein kinase n=1 Tax=Batrachochytrium salamandrivorans TaxID=1357716 RepID=A0ABQ8FGZ8_9FUNG|nr:hypothetical protein BASA61_005626 [Batrachochytrium salamandrivorans]KAH6597518.1 hypothetical protein BASA50_004434 [Batrachochytrium salamandrivorans]